VSVSPLGGVEQEGWSEMPLIVLCGHPCSGKSGFAQRLRAALEALGKSVVLVDEPSLHLERNNSYKDSANEKQARGTLKSMVEQTVSRTKFVIFDSLNNIKGYRYELWCIARASGTRYCMIHSSTPADVSREWNAARRNDGLPSYSDEVFEDLVSRMETPDPRNRWDSPLFCACAADPEQVDSAVQSAVVAMTEEKRPSSTRPVADTLAPTCATSNALLSSTNLLAELDRAAQEVLTTIISAQQEAGGTAQTILMGPGLPSLELHRPVVLSGGQPSSNAYIIVEGRVPKGGERRQSQRSK